MKRETVGGALTGGLKSSDGFPSDSQRDSRSRIRAPLSHRCDRDGFWHSRRITRDSRALQPRSVPLPWAHSILRDVHCEWYIYFYFSHQFFFFFHKATKK